MKYLDSVTVSVFAKPLEEDSGAVRQALVELVPFSLEEEKVALKQETAEGFNEQPIHIYSITLTRTAHTNAFLKTLLASLTDEQKGLLLHQKESRLDNDFHFFIRFDKGQWLASRKLAITDSGRCFHVKMHLAVFPARRPEALVLVEKIFKAE